MKNALLLVGIWVGIILFAYAVVYLPGDRTPRVTLPGDVETADEIHGFSLPLPQGWSLRSTDAAAILVAPIAGIEAWALAVPGTTVDEVLSAAWETVDPCSSCERPLILESVPPGGGRDGAALVLGRDDQGRTGRVVVLLLGESARVFLIRLDSGVTLPARVADDLARMQAGFGALVPEAAPVEAAPEPGI
jgi:hypothetical protein